MRRELPFTHFSMGDKPRAELFSALAHLYRTRDYSDLVIFAKDGSRYPVHRCIICPRSKHFASIVREGRWRDGNEGHIAVEDEEPEVVRLIVEYLYLLDYDPIPRPPPTPSSSTLALTHAEDSGSSHGDFSDTMSVRTEPGQYGHVYGTSAVSAFGGPVATHLPTHHHNSSSRYSPPPHAPLPPPSHLAHPSPPLAHPSPPLSSLFRPRADSSLTVHALPTSAPDFGGVDLHRVGPGGGNGGGGGGGGSGGGGGGAKAGTSASALPLRRRQTTAVGTGRGGAGKNFGFAGAPEVSPLATVEAHLVLHARIYAAAARFGVEGLRALALDKFKIQVTRHWDSVEFPEAIHIVYHSTPATDKDMREAVADTLEWHNRLLDKPEVEIAIMEIDGLAYELLKRSRRAEPEYMD